jgi:tripartite ATP-independent transporter DctM subunit
MGVPVGRLFMGAVIPGLLLVLLFLIFIILVAWLKPSAAPALADEKHRWNAAFGKRIVFSLLPPLFLILAVLGSIFFGIAAPTESAAVGAAGGLLLAAMHRRLTWQNLHDAITQTARLTSMVFIILVGATAFGLVFRGMGGDHVVHGLFTSLPGGEWGFIGFSMLLIFLLGFFLDFLEICFIVVPILTPIAAHFGLDLLWFGVIIGINLQTSFLTPPFGFSLFYLKAVTPPEVRISVIYRGIIPFVLLQIIGLILVIVYPDLVTWLPEWMDKLQGFK